MPDNQLLPPLVNRQPAEVDFVRIRPISLLLTCRAISREFRSELRSYFSRSFSMRSFFSGVLHLPDQALNWDRVFQNQPHWRWIMPRVTKFSLVAFWTDHDSPQQTVFPNLREVMFYCSLNKIWRDQGPDNIIPGSLGEWHALRDAFNAIEERQNWPIVPTVLAMNGGARCEINLILACTARTDDGSLKQRKILVSLEQPLRVRIRAWPLDFGLDDHTHLENLPASLCGKADLRRVCASVDDRMLFEYTTMYPGPQ